jgi:hypothetical protein
MPAIRRGSICPGSILPAERGATKAVKAARRFFARAKKSQGATAMQAIFEYFSVGDLWGLAIIGGAMLILGANCSYQKRRTPACDRIAARLARRKARPAPKVAQPVGDVAHA